MRNRFSCRPMKQRYSLTAASGIVMDNDGYECEPMLGDGRSGRSEKNAAINIRHSNAVGNSNGISCIRILLFTIVTFVMLTLLLVVVLLVVTIRLKTELIDSRDLTYQQIADSFKRLQDNMQKMVKEIPQRAPAAVQRFRDALQNMAQIPRADDLKSIEAEIHYGTAHVNSDSEKKQSERDPLCSRSCSNPRYERHHPLLVISFDGFAHEYVGRNIMKTLDRFKKCGTTAKWMYAAYPTKTFPNHYTMATGLYPESHGIIDNEVHDAALSDNLVDTRKTSDSRYFKGEPIWVTAAKHNLTTACLFWAGCAIDFNGIQPTFNPQYDPTMSFKAEMEKLIDWLLLPENSRPSLLMAYFNQPDYAGHFQHTDEEVNESLKRLNSALNFLLDLLTVHNLLGCLNIIIVSDHGMQKLERRFYVDQILNTEGMIVSSSVVTRVELANSRFRLLQVSALNKSDVIDNFRCKNHGTVFRIYDKQHIPKRYHYEASNRIGDFVIEGQPGTTFYATLSKDIGLTADHGYDYLISNMRTIFYAAGPSILPNKYIEPFQNIELYNLIADLIGVTERAANNGTFGRLHEILVNPPRTGTGSAISTAKVVEECSPTVLFREPAAIACDSECHREQDALSSSLSTCLHGTPYGHFGYSNLKYPFCYVNFCSATALFSSSRKIGQPRVIYEVLTYAEVQQNSKINETFPGCTFVHSQFDLDCSLWNSKRSESSTENQFTFTTLLVNPVSQYRGFADLRIFVYKTFLHGPLEILRKTVLGYVEKHERLIVISGSVNDLDHDGLADDLKATEERITGSGGTYSKIPTHIFMVLIRCESSGWSDDGHSCKNVSQTRVLSFLLPNVPDDLNCLDPLEYLAVNTVRVRDIELLTGLEFFTSRSHYPESISLQLRTYIPDEIWPTAVAL